MILVLLLVLFALGCDSEPPPTAPEDDSPPAASDPAAPRPLVPDPGLDPELQDFLRRAEFLAHRFLTLAPAPEALEAALGDGEDALFGLLEMDAEEGRRGFIEVQREALRLTQRHPELETLVLEYERSGAPVCDPGELSGFARRLREGSSVPVLSVEKETRVVCEQLQYVAALVICAASGNALVYMACAVFAMCNHCSGGLVDTLCGG